MKIPTPGGQAAEQRGAVDPPLGDEAHHFAMPLDLPMNAEQARREEFGALGNGDASDGPRH